MKRIALLLGMAMLAAACSSPKPTIKVDMRQAVAVNKHCVWQLVEMRGKPMPQTGKVITLTLNPEAGTLSGQAFCNRYYADCTQQLRATEEEGTRYELGLSHLQSGAVQCPEADMDTEHRYLTTLAKATHMVVNSTTLTLYQKSKPLLKYEKQ